MLIRAQSPKQPVRQALYVHLHREQDERGHNCRCAEQRTPDLQRSRAQYLDKPFVRKERTYDGMRSRDHDD